MKNMTDIYSAIEENLKELSPQLEAKKAAVTAYEQQIETLMGKQETAETELKVLQNRYEALKKMKEAAESADFQLKAREIEDSTGATILQKPPKQISWTRKNGTLIQIDKNQKQIDAYGSQKAAARKLGWDQSSLSKFIQLDVETQIRKKGFAFKWIP